MSALAWTRNVTVPSTRSASSVFARVEVDGRRDTAAEVRTSWLDAVNYEIKDMLTLQKNWDYEGARPVDPGAAQLAADLATELDEQGVVKPFIVPTREGGVGFDWAVGSYRIYFEITDHIVASLIDTSSDEYWEGDLADLDARVCVALRYDPT